MHVYGDWLPRHIFYRFHALCAYLRCLYVAWAVVLLWGSFDVVIADQVRLRKRHSNTRSNPRAVLLPCWTV